MNMQTSPLLDDVWRVTEMGSEQEHLFVLIDHAGCAGLLAKLAQNHSLVWINLFEGTKEANAIEVAPILVDLGCVQSSTGGAKTLLRWLIEVCKTSNSLLLLRSNRTHRNLAEALKRRLDAQLPDEMSVLLRYFDTRVFGALMGVFNAEQQAAFCGVARQWWWLDRSGESCVHRTEELAIDASPSPIVFDNKQQALLIDACEPDAVAQEVIRMAPDLCAKLTRGELHAWVAESLLAAHHHGIESLPMQSLFCIVALERGKSFHEQSPWRDTLKVAREKKHDFSWVLRQVEGVVA